MPASHALESELSKLGGMTWLYAQVCYSEKEFWEIYGREWYDHLRQKYNATSLPSVYEKVRDNVNVETKAAKSSWWLWFLSFWPMSGFRSLWKAMANRQYLLTNRRAGGRLRTIARTVARFLQGMHIYVITVSSSRSAQKLSVSARPFGYVAFRGYSRRPGGRLRRCRHKTCRRPVPAGRKLTRSTVENFQASFLDHHCLPVYLTRVWRVRKQRYERHIHRGDEVDFDDSAPWVLT